MNTLLDERTFRTGRTLPHPPEAVYQAFASAGVLASWWGPQGFSNSFEVFEFKVGARWKFVMHGPDGQSYPNECLFAALEPGARVVIDHVCAPLFVLSVRLEPVPDGTRLTWEQTFADARTAQAVRAIVEPANEQNLDRLATALALQAAA